MKILHRLKQSFMDPRENMVDILGEDTAKKYLSEGVTHKGFAVLSDKRVYFKSKCYLRNGNGFSPVQGNRVVDLNNITGTDIVKQGNAIVAALFYITFFISCFLYISWPFWIIYALSKKQWAKKVAIGIQCIIFLMPLAYLAWKAVNYSLLEVSYVGGGIGINLSDISKEELDRFQKSLQKAKQEHGKEMLQGRNSEYIPSLTGVKQEMSIPAQLPNGSVVAQEKMKCREKEPEVSALDDVVDDSIRVC